jgi:hypothetical protein
MDESVRLIDPEHEMKLLLSYRPWEHEPDTAEWTCSRTGYRCRIWRNPESRTLCGYVGIPRDHRLYGLDYNDSRVESEIDIHGGLTFSEQVNGLTWFGFDCNHANDFSPGVYLHYLTKNLKDIWEEMSDPLQYRTWDWVEKEITCLALELLHVAERKDKHVP